MAATFGVRLWVRYVGAAGLSGGRAHGMPAVL